VHERVQRERHLVGELLRRLVAQVRALPEQDEADFIVLDGGDGERHLGLGRAPLD